MQPAACRKGYMNDAAAILLIMYIRIVQARKQMAEHEAEMGDLRSEFQEVLQADEGKLSQMARLLASIQDLQHDKDSLTSQLSEAQMSSEVTANIFGHVYDIMQSIAFPRAVLQMALGTPQSGEEEPLLLVQQGLSRYATPDQFIFKAMHV